MKPTGRYCDLTRTLRKTTKRNKSHAHRTWSDFTWNRPYYM